MYAISKMRSLLSTPTSLPRFSQLCTTHFPFQTQMIRRPRACPNTQFFLSKSASKAYSVQSSGETQHVRSVDDGIGDLIGFGEIHVIIGPMFAGKTTALLHRVQTERSRGRNVVMIKSNKDNRYGLDSVVTHDGAKMPCWALSDLSSFRAKIGAEAYDKLDVIGIDEAQFFEDLYDFCRHAADHDGKAVIVAGLDGDYLRRSFGSVIGIIPLADSVTKLTAQCEVCGKCAFFTLRKTEQTKTEVIGGADVYMPVCRQHYVNGQVVIKAARHVLETKKGQCDSYLEVGSLPS